MQARGAIVQRAAVLIALLLLVMTSMVAAQERLRLAPAVAAAASRELAVGATCGPQDVLPGDPKTPITTPDTLHVLSGHRGIIVDAPVTLNDRPADGYGFIGVCAIEQLPAQYGTVQNKNPGDADPTADGLYVRIAPEARGSVFTTYYAYEAHDSTTRSVKAETVTFDITYVRPLIVRRAEGDRHKYRLINRSVATMGIGLANTANPKGKGSVRYVTLQPGDTKKLRTSGRRLFIGISATAPGIVYGAPGTLSGSLGKFKWVLWGRGATSKPVEL